MSLREGVTLVIPTIPPREAMLTRALKSAVNQRTKFSDFHIAYDLEKTGAAATRSRGLDGVTTRWVAFLDDDDELYPHHLETLIHAAIDTGADLVYPWFDVAGGTDPFPMFEGREFDPELPNMFPITVLARTELMHATGGFRHEPSPLDPKIMEGEDWIMWLNVVRAGGTIRHIPERTWLWHHDSGNTSGLPNRW